jgi:hypothetical protein
MGANKIEIYQRNTCTKYLQVEGLNLTGYDTYLTVKNNTTDTSYLLDVSLSVVDSSTILINIASNDVSSLSRGEYIYDITAVKDNSIYTITKDIFTVLDAVRY